MEETAGDIIKGAIDPETLYTRQNCIGGGSFGKVYKGVDKRTGEAVAIKVVEIEGANDDVREIIEEISILAGLHSSYVTKYYGSYLKGSDLWIIMEYCGGGSCADLLDSGPISEEYISIIMKELLMGLDYLHSDKKLHRDIKAANILLGTNGQVKLADFGVSGQLTATMTKKNTFVGTPFWMAPEVIKQSGYNYSADIWSLGITAIELAKQQPPHFDIHPMKVLFIIPKQPPPVLDGDFSPAFKDLVALCLRKDPRERPSAKELLKHPFIRKAGKPVFLTELIERHERYTARNPGNAEHNSDDDEQRPQQRTTDEDEDLWDFGTVRPGQRGGGLRVMNDAGMNARNTVSRTSSPTKAAHVVEKNRTPPKGVYNSQMLSAIPSPARSSPRGQAANRALSPAVPDRLPPPPPLPIKQSQPVQVSSPNNLTRKPVPTPLQIPVSRQSSNVQLDQSLERNMSALNLGSMSPIPAAFRAQQTPTTSAWSPHPTQGPAWSPHPTQSPARPIGPQRADTAVWQSQLPRPQRIPSNSNIPSPSLTRTQSSTSQISFPPPPTSQPATPVIQQQQLPAFPLPVRQQTPVSAGYSYLPQPSHQATRSASGSTLASQASNASFSSNSSSSTTTSPLPQPLISESTHADEITALTGVIVPALAAAVNRRQYSISLLHRQCVQATGSMSSTGSGPSGFAPDMTEQRRRQLQGQENIRRLVGKVSRLFTEIDKWDCWAPVDMGGDVPSFCEGLLEEILNRVEEVEEGGEVLAGHHGQIHDRR